MKNCLIINPGIISEELLLDNYINKKYNFNFYRSNKNWVEDFEYLSKYDIILLEDYDGYYEDKFIEFQSKIDFINKKIIPIDLFFEKNTRRIPLFKMHDLWYLSNNSFTSKNIVKSFLIKRYFDLILVLILLPISILLIILASIFIKATSSGPIFFTQNRVGLRGKHFVIYKLRTMFHKTEGHVDPTRKDDDRIFPVGLILRKLKIDELPQLLNIILGDMSFIGPRPERVEIVNLLCKEYPLYSLRHMVRPGLSGWAQVNNPTATPDDNLVKLEYDLYYIKNPSILLELKIYFRTFLIIINKNSL